MLAAFVVVMLRLQLGGSRLEASTDPVRALAQIAERSMDAEEALALAPAWERRLYEITLVEDGTGLAQLIGWYEELAESGLDEPDVDLRLAVLYGEAGRLADVRDLVARWEAQGAALVAEVVAAAYLGLPPDVDPAALREGVARLISSGWFHDHLAWRLALRTGDAAWLAAVEEGTRVRLISMLRSVRALVAVDGVVLLLGLVAGAAVLRGRSLRVAEALLPPPWGGRAGIVVLVRGAAAGVLVAVGIIVASRWVDTGGSLADTLSLLLMYAPVLLLFAYRLLAPHGRGLVPALGLVPAPGGWAALARAATIVTAAGAALDLVLGLLGGAGGVPPHWTEWFDEDLAWGTPVTVAASLVGTVLLAPVLEEIVFRGLLYGTLRRRLSWPAAALISAGIFAAAHGYGVAGFGSVLASGVLWAVAYEKTGSLLPGIVAHVANNCGAAATVLWLVRA